MDDKGKEEKIATLQAEISAKDIRIATLDMQLVQSAQDYTRKISDLKMQIFELEINQSMAGSTGEMEGSGSPTSALQATRPGASVASSPKSPKPTGNGAKAAKSLQQGRRGSNVFDT